MKVNLKNTLPWKMCDMHDGCSMVYDCKDRTVLSETDLASFGLLEQLVEMVNTDKFILRLNKDLTHEDFDGIVGYEGEYFWPSVVSANRNFYYKLDLSVGGYFDESFFDVVEL